MIDFFNFLNDFISKLDPVSFVFGIFVIFTIEICFNIIEFLKLALDEDLKKDPKKDPNC